MNTWAAKIEEFAKPAHKNIAVLIPNRTSEEIETAFDAIAKDAKWTYKEIKEKNGKRVLCYQTASLSHTRSGGFQIIECTLIPKSNNIHLDIESRYIATQNKQALLLYFYGFGTPNEFYDFYSKNRENLEIIISSLKIIFPNFTIVETADNDSNKDAVNKKISTISLLTAILKIYYLFIIIILLYASFLTLILVLQVYYHLVLNR